MRKYLVISAATVVAGLTLAVGVNYAFASTTDVLTYGSQGGTNVAVGNVLKSSLGFGIHADFSTAPNGSSGGNCSTGSLTAKVTANPAAGGTASASVTSQSFSGCTDNLSLAVNSITVTTPYTISANSTSNDVSIASTTATIIGTIDNGNLKVICNYKGTNVSGSTSATNQHFVVEAGSNQWCPSDTYLTATYTSTVDTSVSGDPTVYENS